MLVRERLKTGDSDQQVLDFLVARYGEFVLLNPRFNWHTALLWLGPPTVLLGGALALLLFAWRRAARSDAPAPETSRLSPAEEARLEHLLKNSEG